MRTHLGEEGTRIPLKDALTIAQRPLSKEEKAARGARYRQEHREEVAAYRARYYQEHREEVAAKKARYREEHREEYNTYMRNYMRARAAQRRATGVGL